jgi:ubiquinone/menaquinone biosynthesis C-methylase UbiE
MARLPRTVGDVLDVGCGTGALLTRLMNDCRASRLTGVDASGGMLDIARERLSPDVALRECWAEQLPFDDCSFDTVVSCNMFHFIRRPSDALNEMLRVLRPNGVVIITDWCDDYLTCKLCDIYLRWVDPSHFRMYGVSKCRELLEAANAKEIEIDKYKITLLWGLMTATARKYCVSSVEETANPLQYTQ